MDNINKRNNTLFDRAGLRIHPDGTRVPPPQPIASSSAVTLDDAPVGGGGRAATNAGKEGRNARWKHTKKDRAGNWVASDVAGTRARPPRKRRRRADGSDEEVDEDKESDEGEVEDERPVKDPRARRRREYRQDTSALLPSNTPSARLEATSSVSQDSEQEDTDEDDYPGGRIPIPKANSNYLNSIHRRASQFYTARGEMYNAARDARRTRRARKRRRIEKREAGEDGEDRSAGDNEEVADGGSGNSKTSSSSSSSSSSESDSDSESDEDGKRKQGEGGAEEEGDGGRDMYRRFEGGALAAIGMLIHGHIRRLVATRVREGWAEEMAREEARARAGGRGKKGKKGRAVSVAGDAEDDEDGNGDE